MTTIQLISLCILYKIYIPSHITVHEVNCKFRPSVNHLMVSASFRFQVFNIIYGQSVLGQFANSATEKSLFYKLSGLLIIIMMMMIIIIIIIITIIIIISGRYSPWWNFLLFYSLLTMTTVSRTPWAGDQAAVRTLPTQDNTNRINEDKYSGLERNSNPRSQFSSGRRQFIPYTARPLWSAMAGI
jgi:glucan phosphoethanolaminetransferase (alkaline phosphatase superfamily)